MNYTIGTILNLLVLVAGLWLAVLLVASRLFRVQKVGAKGKTLAGLVSILVLLIPISGAPVWKHIQCLFPSLSLPLLCAGITALWSRLSGVVLLRPADWRAFWIFGAVTGSVLYLHQMLVGSIDLYYWGWERGFSLWALGIAATVFFCLGNRLGVLLLAALLAFSFTIIESRNCWDYLMDPVYWLISLGVVTVWACSAAVRWSGKFFAARNPAPHNT